MCHDEGCIDDECMYLWRLATNNEERVDSVHGSEFCGLILIHSFLLLIAHRRTI